MSKAGRRGWRAWGLGGTIQEWPRGLEGFVSRMVFKGERFMRFAVGLTPGKTSWSSFWPNSYFLGHIPFRLTKCLPSFFMVINSKSLRAFCFPGFRVGWREGHACEQIDILQVFVNSVTDREKRPARRKGSGFHFCLGGDWFLSFKGLIEEVRVLEREEAREKEKRENEIYDLLDPRFYVA